MIEHLIFVEKQCTSSTTARVWAPSFACRLASVLVNLNRHRAGLLFAERASRLVSEASEPWVAIGTIHFLMDREGAALEAFMAANTRDPDSRVIALLIGLVLEELEMCEQSHEWLLRAADAARAAEEPLDDGHPDSMFWRELGLHCLYHGKEDDARERAVLAELMTGWSGGNRKSAVSCR